MTNLVRNTTGRPSTLSLVEAPVPPVPPPISPGSATVFPSGAGRTLGHAGPNDELGEMNVYLRSLRQDNHRIREDLSNPVITSPSITPWGDTPDNEILNVIQLELQNQSNSGGVTPIVYDPQIATTMIENGYRPLMDAARNYQHYRATHPNFAGLDPNMSSESFFNLFLNQVNGSGVRYNPLSTHLIRDQFVEIIAEFEGTPSLDIFIPSSSAALHNLQTMVLGWLSALVGSRPSLGFGVFSRLLFHFAIAAFRTGLGSLNSPLFTFFESLAHYRNGDDNSVRFSYYMLRWMAEDFVEVFAAFQGNVEPWMTTAGGVTFVLYTIFRLLGTLVPYFEPRISLISRISRYPTIIWIGIRRTFTLLNITNPVSRTRLYRIVTRRNNLILTGVTVIYVGVLYTYPGVIPYLSRNLFSLVDSSHFLLAEARQLFELLLEYWKSQPK